MDAQGKRRVAMERVCDGCFSSCHNLGSRRPSLVSDEDASLSASSCTDDSYPLTPGSEDPPSLNSSAIRLPHQTSLYFRSTPSSRSTSTSHRQATALAPIEPWMDNSGVLSLYPLAVQPSHSRRAKSPHARPAAGPLFGPSLRALRSADEKETQRLTLRQRRMGADADFWVPQTWGYTRAQFDSAFSDDEDERETATGGLVVDGPIVLRAHPKPRAEVITEARARHLSTF
ncbi:hypothetical protein P7C73_g6832, partial [Tremellales sp. Uapishka_1]